MTRNPYAQLGGPGGGGAPGPGPYDQGYGYDPGPSRTSALAVASLVFGLVCVIPGAGLLAVLLGVPALFIINASRGRLRGTGLAVTGVSLGLLFSAAWVLVIYATAFFNRQFGVHVIGPVKEVMVGIEASDRTKARSLLVPAVNQTVTDEDFDRFRAAYQAELGSFKAMPESLWDTIQAYLTVGQAMQGYQSPANRSVFPLPATFDKGPTLVLVESPAHQRGPQPAPGGTFNIPMVNVGVVTPAGKEIWLIDPATRPLVVPQPPQPGAGTPAPPEPTDPEGTAPKPDSPAPPPPPG